MQPDDNNNEPKPENADDSSDADRLPPKIVQKSLDGQDTENTSLPTDD